jgi:isochorismate pyruvate lyase
VVPAGPRFSLSSTPASGTLSPPIRRDIEPSGSVQPGPPTYQNEPVVSDSAPDDLGSIRDRLDVVDRRLVAVLADRAALISEVIRYKRAQGMKVVDRAREEEMLEKIGGIAAESGLDPRIARQVLRAVIDAFTILEVEQLGPDS